MTRRARILAAGLAILAALTQTEGRALDAVGGATLVAARPIRAGELIRAGDVLLQANATPGALSDPAQALGMEAVNTIYRGRAVMPYDIGPPAMVERNQIVTMTYERGFLSISAEGRALDRAGAGQKLRVMNLDSRTTVTAIVTGPGLVEVR
jgi:flagella basal body P-ring formation protein FlgA